MVPPRHCPQVLSLHPNVSGMNKKKEEGEKKKKEVEDKKVHLKTHSSTSRDGR